MRTSRIVLLVLVVSAVGAGVWFAKRPKKVEPTEVVTAQRVQIGLPQRPQRSRVGVLG